MASDSTPLRWAHSCPYWRKRRDTVWDLTLTVTGGRPNGPCTVHRSIQTSSVGRRPVGVSGLALRRWTPGRVGVSSGSTDESARRDCLQKYVITNSSWTHYRSTCLFTEVTRLFWTSSRTYTHTHISSSSSSSSWSIYQEFLLEISLNNMSTKQKKWKMRGLLLWDLGTISLMHTRLMVVVTIMNPQTIVLL